MLIAQDDVELYLLDFHSDGYLLAESVPAYESNDIVYIDFALFLEALEFPIEQEEQLWSGWFRAEDRRFSWRTDLGIVQVADSYGERIEQDEWLDAYDGTFVAIATLERWFDITIAVDIRNQVLTINSTEPLPFQLWRERMLAKYRYRPGDRGNADVLVADTYHWATVPLIDLSTNLRTQRRDGANTSSGTASLALGMDLLKHSVVYTGAYANGTSNQDASTNRLTIERKSATPDSAMIGGVHGYILGDIYQSGSNLVSSSNTGRGFRIDRYPEGRSGNFNLATIAGDAPPGWEVELYRNDVLLEFATVGPDGRYFFPDQEVPFGENIFVAKLYGPQGQTREDRQVFWGGATDLAKGDYDFSFSHIDFDRYLLDGAPENAGALPASYATNIRYSQALTEDLELGAAFTRAGLGNRDRDGTYADSNYLSVYGSMKLGPGVLAGEVAHQLDFGHALHLEYLTGLHGHRFRFVHESFNDYSSPATIHRNDLDALNEVSVFGAIGEDNQVAYTVGVRQRDLANGPSDWRLFNQVSMRLGRLSLTNDLDHHIGSGPDSTSGHLRVATRVNGVSMRGQLDYILTDSQPLKQISASTNWQIGRRLNNNLMVSKRLVEDRKISFTNLLSLRIRDYDVTFSLNSDLERDWSVGAGFDIAFGYDRYAQSFVTDVGGMANTGRATMNIFIDEDNDGIRDPQEPPVAWARYRDLESMPSNPGAVRLTALPGSRAVQLDMKHLELNDPFLVPRAKTYELHTHPGSDVDIDVAVLLTGDIEGTILAGSSGDTSGVRGVIVTLHDAEGREVARTRSEFDGFYSFTSVPGGDYEVRIHTKRSRNELTQKFSLDANDGYIVLEKIYIFE